MTIEEAAETIGVDTQQLFVRAHAMYGKLWGLGGPVETHARWKKRGTVPMYVTQYVRYLERRAPVVNGAAVS